MQSTEPTREDLEELYKLLAARGATLLLCVAEFISEIVTIPRSSEL